MRQKPEFSLLLGAIALAFAGYATQKAVGYNAFSRSGSLITAYGVAMAGLEIVRSERAILRHEARVEKLEAAYMDAVGNGDKAPDPGAFSRIAESRSEFLAGRQTKLGRLMQTEVAIVCAGTLIWGFGDLVV